MVCHDGSTALEFSVAGTLYVEDTTKEPLVDGIVNLRDSKGATYWAQANCAGNFFVPADDFVPNFPMTTSVQFQGVYTPMETLIHRDGSCATCHTDPASPSSAGHVFLVNIPTPLAVRKCP